MLVLLFVPLSVLPPVQLSVATPVPLSVPLPVPLLVPTYVSVSMLLPARLPVPLFVLKPNIILNLILNLIANFNAKHMIAFLTATGPTSFSAIAPILKSIIQGLHVPMLDSPDKTLHVPVPLYTSPTAYIAQNPLSLETPISLMFSTSNHLLMCTQDWLSVPTITGLPFILLIISMLPASTFVLKRKPFIPQMAAPITVPLLLPASVPILVLTQAHQPFTSMLVSLRASSLISEILDIFNNWTNTCIVEFISADQTTNRTGYWRKVFVANNLCCRIASAVNFELDSTTPLTLGAV